MSDLEIFEFLEKDATEQQREKRRKRRKLRNDWNPFDVSDHDFINRYRLNKDMVRNLCDELKPHMPEPKKTTDIPVETKVLVALSFFATGSFQRPTGDITSHSLSQPSVSNCIRQVTKLLNLSDIQSKYIKFPRTPQEREVSMSRFIHKFGIPGTLGCIGCTHVAVVRPKQNVERYYCTKQYHSINLQLICNADMEIISVDAGYGGATDKAYIWAYHPIKHHLQEVSSTESVWLLGDSGYPLSKYMMTPITNSAPHTPESNYTNTHEQARCLIEKTIGLLKARFRCLLVRRALHYEPDMAAGIINACVVLHNICVKKNLPVPVLSEDDICYETTMQPTDSIHHYQESADGNWDLNSGLITRHELVSRLWMSGTLAS